MYQDNHPLFRAIVDSIPESLAVMDQNGDLIFVNQRWREFAVANGGTADAPPGNYLSVCQAGATTQDASSRDALSGMSALLRGETSQFRLEYPCHSPSEKRWFLLDARRIAWSGQTLFVITHKDITRRKKAEQATRELAMTDALTGLANRRQFDLFVEREWQACMRASESLTLIMFDVDHFKQFNDLHGHPAGDRCLVAIAGILRENAHRSRDLCARYGGEEFAMILVGSNQRAACAIGDKIRQEIEALHIPASQDGTRVVTISAGVASTVPFLHEQPWQLLSEADRALYQAKSNGRNCVVCTSAKPKHANTGSKRPPLSAQDDETLSA